MNQKKRIKTIAFSAFIIINIIAFMFASFTFAKYSQTESVEDKIVFEDFNVSIDKINGLDLAALRSSGKMDQNGVVTLTKDEYKKFSLSIKYQGKGKSYIRIMVQESWINYAGGIQTVVFSKPSNFQMANGFFDNRSHDGFLYSVKPTYNESNAERVIPVISGITTNPTNGIDTTHVKIIVTIDAVQYNRYKALWNISEIPH